MIETVGELKEMLKDIPDDYSIYGLEFYSKGYLPNRNGYLSKIGSIHTSDQLKKVCISLEERTSEKFD